jgi:DNA-binding SARP family transcriptional activator
MLIPTSKRAGASWSRACRRASSYLQLRQDMLVLAAPGGLWIDVEAFLTAARAAHERRTARAYREALRLYTGELVLEEHDEDWAITQRDWLSGLRVTLLVELAGVQEQAGDLSAAIATVQQAVASAPLHEEGQGLLMRLLVQTGRRRLALRHYQALRAALQRELHGRARGEPAGALPGHPGHPGRPRRTGVRSRRPRPLRHSFS